MASWVRGWRSTAGCGPTRSRRTSACAASARCSTAAWCRRRRRTASRARSCAARRSAWASARLSDCLPSLAGCARWRPAPAAVAPAEPPSMLAVDPPQHTKYRRLVSKVFTPRAMAAMEPRVEEIASELLDEMAKHETVDLVDMYAGPLPVRVISEILGVPAYMQDSMLEWGNAAAVTLDPALHYRQFRDASRALRRIHTWLDNHLKELRRNPGDDLLSRLALLVDEGENLDDVELRSTALLVIGAGFETTVNLIGNAVTQLLAHPAQLDSLKADASGWPNAVDEVLRFDSPVQVTVRIAGEDTHVGDHEIPVGRFVSLMLGGANRDPEVF